MGKMTINTVARNQIEQDGFFLASIVEHSADAIISMTLEGLILSWNSAAERVYGYTAEEIIGQSISMLVPPHNLNELLQILERVKQGKCVDHIETMRMRKEGQPDKNTHLISGRGKLCPVARCANCPISYCAGSAE